jgi:hypothetical protein
MIFGYTLAEAKKTVIAVITFGAAVAAMFIAYNPGINEAAITLAGAIFGVIGVFLSPQFSIEDLSKAVAALQGALIALGNFFFVIHPSTVVQITTVVGSAIALYALYRANNEKNHNAVSV